MVLPHPLLRRLITEHMILLLIGSTHTFSYHMLLWIGSSFQQPARRTSATMAAKASSPTRAALHEVYVLGERGHMPQIHA